MKRLALAFVVVAAVTGTSPVLAETETDRLRDAVRTLTGQLRVLEDQRVQNQTRVTQAEREKLLATQAAEKLRTQLKELEKTRREDVDEFNKRLANRDETLEKWKAAYAEAAGVAREKDALRAKFEEEAGVFRGRTKSCEAKNVKLLKVSGEILAAFRDLKPIDVLAINEPLIGYAKVDHQNKVQDFQDKIVDQDYRTPDAPPPPDNAGEQKKDQAAKPDGKSANPKNPQSPGAAKPQQKRQATSRLPESGQPPGAEIGGEPLTAPNSVQNP
jgi:hypothetical protein